MAKIGVSKIFGTCCGPVLVKSDESWMGNQHSAAVKSHLHESASTSASITVRTFIESSGGASDSSRATANGAILAMAETGSCAATAWGGEEWHDAQEEFDAAAEILDTVEVKTPCEGVRTRNELPAGLSDIVRAYEQGRIVGCKPAVSIVKYMEASNTSILQLKEQLAPLVAAEEAAGCKDQPTPTPDMDPLVCTQTLHNAAAQQQSGITTNSRQPQQPRPSISRLLGNVCLMHDTLAYMSIERDGSDGFKQVAHGNLELWYKHDTINRCQVIRAKTVLDEPIQHAVCLAREFDLVPVWNPAIQHMKELGSYSSSELLMYMLLWTPWPAPQPEVINYSVGLDLLDTKHEAVFIGTRNGAHMVDDMQLPHNPRAQRLTMNAGGFLFKPLPPDPGRPNVPRMEAVVLVCLDATTWALPDGIISWILKIFAPLVYKSVINVLKRMFNGNAGNSSALLARLALRPEYAGIAAHVQKHLRKKAQQHQNREYSAVESS